VGADKKRKMEDAFGLRSRTSQSGSGRLTISAARTNVALFIHRAVCPPGFTGRKPSGIPAATVSRPWGFGQFQLSSRSSLGVYIAPPVTFAQSEGVL
jgi:hypothetical protein